MNFEYGWSIRQDAASAQAHIWMRILRSPLHYSPGSKASFAMFLAAGFEDLVIRSSASKEFLC